MAQDLNQVPPGAEVWDVDGTHYVIYFMPDSQPPIPLAWMVRDSEDRKALGIDTDKVDRTFSSYGDFLKTGALRHGTTLELANLTENPWETIKSNYKTEVRVKPWLGDPEILSLWLAASLEGRSISDAELQGTEWWRTHTESERAWISLNASDPASADRLIADNRAQVADLFRTAGVDNASDDLIQLVADKWTTGAWSQVYATQQIRLLADPYMQGDLDPALKGSRTGLDTTREREDTVRALIQEWLGPAHAGGYTDKSVAKWASRLRNDPDARLELEEALRRQRMSLFPEYENPNLTYEDIAAPWRGVWQQMWGQTADEMDPLFAKIVKMNDLAEAQKTLRKEGLTRRNGTVTQSAITDTLSAFGGQVRRSDPAVL